MSRWRAKKPPGDSTLLGSGVLEDQSGTSEDVIAVADDGAIAAIASVVPSESIGADAPTISAVTATADDGSGSSATVAPDISGGAIAANPDAAGISGSISYGAPTAPVAAVGDGAVTAANGTPGGLAVVSSVSVGVTEISSPESNTPSVVDSFNGIGYTGWIPPDPHGAAGNNHLVSVVNSSLVGHTKAGVQQFNLTLDAFFGGGVSGTFDPKVIYDHHSDRFLLTALDTAGISTGTQADDVSRFLLGVSDDGDPNGTWYLYSFNALVNSGGNNYWADYPGFAVDDQRVYITHNYFGTEGGGFLDSFAWVIDKNIGSGLYSGGSATGYRYQPYTQSSHGGADFTLQPAHVLAGDVPGSAGTFLVGFDGFVGGNDDLDVIRMDFSGNASTGTFNFQNVVVGDVTNASVPDAPQLGTTTLIDAGDDRTYQAVWRDNSLWVVNTVSPGSGANAGQATAHWYQINTSNQSALALTQHGDIGAEDLGAGTHTYYPSVAVNMDGIAAFGFAASSGSIYAGSYYTMRAPGDAANTVQDTEVLRAGQGTYARFDSVGRNRWGDYTGIAVDPANDKDFWLFNEHATNTNTWQTAWGRIALNAADDYAGDITTTGQLAINGSIAGNIEVAGDRDWFRVQLTAGTTYTINLEGSATSAGTLSDPYLYLYNGLGQLITQDDDSGVGLNSQLSYSPSVSGSYYLGAGAYADISTGTYRLSATGAVLLPDLSAQLYNMGSPTVAAGGNLAVDLFTFNLGSGAAAASTTRLYLSSDQTIDTSDRLIASVDSGSMTAYQGSHWWDRFIFSAQVPGDLTPSTYWLGGLADYNNQVAESSETNNTYNIAQVTVTGGAQPPEITVLGNGMAIADGDTTPSSADHTDFGSSTLGGTPVTRTFTVRNDGGSTLTLGTPTLPAGFSLVAGDPLVSSLAPGAADTFQVRLDTSSTGTKSGQISFSNNDGNENPFNFSITGTVGTGPQPDLSAQLYNMGSPTVAAGGNLAVDLFTFNLGSGAAAASTTRLYLSSDQTIDTSDRLIASVDSGSMTAYQGSHWWDRFIFSAQVPGDLTPSTYWLGGLADYNNQVAESSETNNTYNIAQVTVTTPQSTFDVDIDFSGDPAYDSYFEAAATRWEQIITADLPNVVSGTYGAIDDLLISANVVSIDGPGGILGQAGPDLFRSGSLLPYHGGMEFDSADLAMMVSNGTLPSVILHEMGHILGIGTLWSSLGLTSGFNYLGQHSLDQYRILSGNPSVTSVPIQSSGGPGTAGSHWAESIFGNELMSPYISGAINPLSVVTIGSLHDMGYTVNYSAADAFMLPGLSNGLDSSSLREEDGTMVSLVSAWRCTVLEPNVWESNNDKLASVEYGDTFVFSADVGGETELNLYSGAMRSEINYATFREFAALPTLRANIGQNNPTIVTEADVAILHPETTRDAPQHHNTEFFFV